MVSKNDPDWSTQVDTVWMWDEYPSRWSRDCGADLVFKHKNGETWAIKELAARLDGKPAQSTALRSD